MDAYTRAPCRSNGVGEDKHPRRRTGSLGLSPEDEFLEQEDGRDLYEAWQVLTPREQKVLALYCGFTPDGEPRSLRDIGRELGVTRERARQIKNEAVARLRECLCCDEAHSQIA